jgi:hypothetical protein
VAVATQCVRSKAKLRAETDWVICGGCMRRIKRKRKAERLAM